MTATVAGRERLSRNRLRTLVLDAGVALLLEEGLAASRAPIGYADAFRWLERERSLSVSRAQVHRRIWDSIDHYRRDVLTELTSFPPASTYLPTLAAVTTELDDMAGGALSPARATAHERRHALVQLARVAVEANAAASRADRRITAFDALWAMHSFRLGTRHARDPVSAGVLEGQQQSLDRFIAIYDQLAGIFGVEAATHWGIPHEDGVRMYAELTWCLNHGAASRAVDQLEHRPVRLGGERWTVEGLTAAAVTGCVASLAEPPTRSAGGSCVVVPQLVTNSNNVRRETAVGSSNSSRRGPRMERSELRRHMLDAGTALLIEGGFGHGAEHITYRRVFERVERGTGLTISRAQVHGRIWANQLEFQLDVLARAASRATPGIGAPVVEGAVGVGDESTPFGSAAAVIRSVAARAINDMASDRAWLVAQAIASFHAVNPHRSERLGATLRDAYERDVDAWRQLYRQLCDLLGLVARSWTDASTDAVCTVLAYCSDALAEGVTGRMRMSGRPPTYELRVAGADPAEWELFGIGLWSLVSFLLVPGGLAAGRPQNST